MDSDEFPEWFWLECKMSMADYQFSFWFKDQDRLYKFSPDSTMTFLENDFLKFEDTYYVDVRRRKRRPQDTGFRYQYTYVIESHYSLSDELSQHQYERITSGEKVEVDLTFYKGVFN